MALPKAKRNSDFVSATALPMFSGLASTGSVARNWASGSGNTPLIWAGSIATAARPMPSQSSRSAISPPNEWPMRIGGDGNSLAMAPKNDTNSLTPLLATRSWLARASATVLPSPGQPGATGS